MLSLINKKRNKKGFTLVELVVVIAILGILAALAVPRFSGFTEAAKQRTDEQMADVVANAAIVYYGVEKALPTMKQLSDGEYIEKEYQASDLTSKKYTAGTEVFTIAAPATGATGTVVVTIGGTTTYVVTK